jgi:hypothetical protein
VTALVLALALHATWSDASGRLQCAVPDAFTPKADQPWLFTRGDGLRKVFFLTVKPVAEGPDIRAQQLLARVQHAPEISAAMAIAPLEPTWAGVLVLGPRAADLQAEARALTAQCRAVAPAIENGRIRDVTRRMSGAVPAGLTAKELRNAGALEGQGFTLRLISLQPRGSDSLDDVAAGWLAPSGAKVEQKTTAEATEQKLTAVVESGTLVQGGNDYVIIVAAVDFGTGEVGGISVSASAAVQTRAKATLEEVLRTLRIDAPPPEIRSP